MEIIKENWKAIEDYEKKAREKTGDPDAGFNPTLFFLDGVKKLVINIKYRGKKGPKNNRQFTQSYKDLSTIAKYCPFTGKPLYKDLDDE